MSARVVVDSSYPNTRYVEVPAVDRAEIDQDGRLRLYVGYGDARAIFRATQWDYFTISPERGPDGKFVKKGGQR